MDVFVARQPILDLERRVFGYELLFRSGPENYFTATDMDRASSEVIQRSLLVFLWDTLLAGRKGFINVTRRILVDELYSVLPPTQTVVELLESVTPDPEVLAACKNLKRAGYQLALDDFVMKPEYEALLPLVDVLKIDLLATPPDQIKEIAERFRGTGVKLLAEKVETAEIFEQTGKLGYTLFQGYFFCRPEMVRQKDVKSSKLSQLRFLQEIHRPDLDFRRLEQVFRQDVALSVKLLRYLNSAAFGLKQKVTSIKDGLVMLGERPLKKWASLAAFSQLAEDKPQELIATALIRARMCELLGPAMGVRGRELELFLTGMLSTLDALLDRPLAELLAQLSISDEVKATLTGGAPTSLSEVFQTVLSGSEGRWDQLSPSVTERVVGGAAALGQFYRDAVQWADNVAKA